MPSGPRSPERTLHPRHRALGKEEHHDDEENAVDDQVDAGPAAPRREVQARQLGERTEDEGPHDGPEERAGAADDGTDDDLDRERDAEDRVGLEREQVKRVERPADAGQERRDDHREHLVAKRRHADGLGGALVLADGRQVHTEAAAIDGRGHGRGRNHQAERDVVVGARVLELGLPRVAGGRDVEADGRGAVADADEGGVAGRERPRVRADNAPGLTEVGAEEDEDEHRAQVGAQHQRQGQQHDDGQRRQVLQIARLPKMPAGLTRRITTRSAKLTSSFIDGLRNTAPSDSATETISPPTNAPSTLPIPPMMTMLKDVTESWRPVGGWKGSSGATSAPAAPTQAAPTANATAETWRTSVPMTCAP